MSRLSSKAVACGILAASTAAASARCDAPAGACRLEVCCGDVESALAAHRGGADRIELCANLPEGGTTPSFGAIARVAAALRAPPAAAAAAAPERARDDDDGDDDAAAPPRERVAPDARARAAPCRLHVLIRPRAGDFVYTAAELGAMLDDVAAAKRAGADGVVIGALSAAGEVRRAGEADGACSSLLFSPPPPPSLSVSLSLCVSSTGS